MEAPDLAGRVTVMLVDSRASAMLAARPKVIIAKAIVLRFMSRFPFISGRRDRMEKTGIGIQVFFKSDYDRRWAGDGHFSGGNHASPRGLGRRRQGRSRCFGALGAQRT